jgi:hypothetical protein
MAATAGLSLTLDPMGKMFQNASSLKPLGQLKPNCPGMIIGRFSIRIAHFVPIINKHGRHRQRQELSMVAIFVNGLGRNEQSQQRISHRCFLPNFGSFGQTVSEEKNFKNQPIRNKNRLWRPCLLTDLDEMSNLYRGPSIDASYQVLNNLAKRFQRRRFTGNSCF